MSPNLKDFDFGKLVEAIQNEVTTASATIKEKTLARFVRPIAISVAFVFASYQLVYAPPQKKASGLQRQIDRAKQTSQYADQYQGLHDQLAAVYEKLPQPKDRERWLTDTLVQALKDDGLIADSIVPPEENVSLNFATQKVTLALTAKFSEIYSLIRHLEKVKPTLHIEGVRIAKDPKIEMTQVSMTIDTIIPLSKPQ